MGSYWLRICCSITGFLLILWLCAGCSDANVARHSGEYSLDIETTESHSPEFRELFDDVVLTLNSDDSFSLTGEFSGVSRTDIGTWRIDNEIIILRFTHVGEREKQFEIMANIGVDTLIFDIPILNRDITATFVKKVFPAWVMSIFATVMLIITRVIYIKIDGPNMTLTGRETLFFMVLVATFVPMFMLGVIGSFKPEVLVWVHEVSMVLSMIIYLGFLTLLAISVIVWAANEGGGKKVLWAAFGLGAIALLAWLYFRFGVEIGVGGL